jgi:hypothetical protein
LLDAIAAAHLLGLAASCACRLLLAAHAGCDALLLRLLHAGTPAHHQISSQSAQGSRLYLQVNLWPIDIIARLAQQLLLEEHISYRGPGKALPARPTSTQNSSSTV